MAQPELAERLKRLQGELASCQPDALRSELPLHSKTKGDTDFQDACREMKRRKLMYLAAESELRILESCTNQKELRRGLPSLEDRERDRLETKKDLRQLKLEIERESDIKQELYMEISRLSREHEEEHIRCTRELREAQHVQSVMADDEKEAQSLLPRGVELGALMDGDPGLARNDDGLLARGAGSLAELSSAEAEEVASQRRQELEAQCLKKALKVAETCREELERCEQEARSKMDDLERHAALEEQFALGLPRITFDDAAGTVTLGWPPNLQVPSEDDVEVRTVSVAFDEQGCLVQARPHPSLELWDEARVSVDKDDLARLLTLVWDRVCQQSEGVPLGTNDGPPAEARDLGGA